MLVVIHEELNILNVSNDEILTLAIMIQDASSRSSLGAPIHPTLNCAVAVYARNLFIGVLENLFKDGMIICS